jgi:single-strand DNA-binding protein
MSAQVKLNLDDQTKMHVLVTSDENKNRNPEKNIVYLEGSVQDEPVRRIFSNGNKLATFMLATVEEFSTRGGERMRVTEVFHVVSWNKVAEVVISNVHKGALVKLRGRLRNSAWTDSDGKQRNRVQIVISEMVPKAA